MPRYIEHCKTVIASINPDELAAFPLGAEVGRPGSTFRLHQLGRLDIAGEPRWIGAKLARIANYDVYDRLREEVAFLTFCLDVQPELKAYVPRFMGILAVEGSAVCAFLTEDASCGGQHAVQPRTASHTTQAMLYAPFSHLGHQSNVLNEVGLVSTTSFDVGGQERLLDFTPPPINGAYLFDRTLCPELWQLENTVQRQTADFTVTVPQDSPLGHSLSTYAPH